MSSISGSSWLCQRNFLLALACYCCLLALANSLWARSETIDDIDALNEKICGLRKRGPNNRRSHGEDIGPRISAGWDAVRGEFPWTVWLKMYYKSTEVEGSATCGGSIIHHNLILTAGHCLKLEGMRPYKITVWPGIMSTSENISAPSFEAETSCIALGWKGLYEHPHEDLGLIKLKSSISYNDDVRPICIHHPRTSGPPTYRACRVSGFGVTDNRIDEKPWNRKLHGLTMEPCPAYLHHSSPVDENEWCMVSADVDRHPGNPCIGDSGGGLVCLDHLRNEERYYLAGVFSNFPNICEPGKPTWGLFARTWRLRNVLIEMYDRCGK